MFKVKDIYPVVTPIFSPEMGERMKTVRMKHLMDQMQLGEKLGVAQQTISKLERGRQLTTENPFSVAQLIELFPKDTLFILLGTGQDRYPLSISHRYWSHKHRPQGRRGPRTGVK